MKQKLLVILLFVSLLFANSGSVLAQGTIPPDGTNNPGSFLKSEFLTSGTVNSAGIAQESKGFTSAASSPLVNGDFEQGPFVGWYEYSNHGWAVVIPATSFPIPPYSGNWLTWLGGADWENSYISQFLTLPNAASLNLHYWIDSSDDCGYDYAQVLIKEASAYYYTVLHQWDLCYSNESSGWMPLNLDLSAYGGQSVDIKIEIHNDVAYTSSLLIDTVSLYTTFADVPMEHMFYPYIEAFFDTGITVGCTQTPKQYCPNSLVTRGEMAVFIERAMGNFSPIPSSSSMFVDVPAGNPFKPFIEEFYNDGITVGCLQSPLEYCPQNNVTRGEMAVFIERAIGNFSPTPSPNGMFTDVLDGNPFKPFIEEFYNDGITVGCTQSPLQYCPQNYVTRGEMAVFIVRAFGIPLP